MNGFVTIDGIKVKIEDEKNILALCKKAKIDIPTFCYHSKLSTYGACRLCLVEINGKDIDASCVVPPKDGMTIRTNTAKIRSMRRMNLELLLANHKQNCPTCERSSTCKLRELSTRMGIREPRFKNLRVERPVDDLSPALVRDPNKCILCGDCVRYCSEIQGIGAIDFTHRGSDVVVCPAFGKSIAEVDCVSCGQCAAVCPTAAIVPKSHVNQVWKELDADDTVVVAQIAPAVRVAIGERFGMKPGENTNGKIATALRMLGFDKIYDTAFGADLTVVEEATEFLERVGRGSPLPLFTSCCPAWVKYAEFFFPKLLPSLSSCMSPQAMMGSIIREDAAIKENLGGKKLAIVSIMPCTAKKYEITRPELSRDGQPLVNWSLTTNELADMIEEAGIRFADLETSSMDMPFGFATGAGVAFGNSGGVSEAVARYIMKGLPGGKNSLLEFFEEKEGVRTAKLAVGERTITITVVQGLANAKLVAQEIIDGKRITDLVEVMACPGGCAGGAGQPIDPEGLCRKDRAEGIRSADSGRELRSTGNNPFITRFYSEILGTNAGTQRAHDLLHTHYASKKRIQDTQIPLMRGTDKAKVSVKVCVGTSCFLRGSQALLSEILQRVESEGLAETVAVSATFCAERCNKGPTVHIGAKTITRATADEVMSEIKAEASL
jgi:NADH-quinone oxidoreductase subunit G